MTARIGDLIYLEDDQKGVLNASVDGSMTVTPASAFSAEANVFLLQQQGTWKRASEYRQVLEKEGFSWIEAQGEPKLRALRKLCSAEKAAYEKEFVRTSGRQLRYGMVVQMKHVASGKFLSSSRLALKTGHGHELVLDHEAGDTGCFKVLPTLRVHNEGEKVHHGDPIFLEEITGGQRLVVCDDHAKLDQLQAAMAHPSANLLPVGRFKLKRFREWRQESVHAKRVLCGGMKVVITHKEAETNFGCDISETDSGEPLSLRRGMKESSSIWEVINENPRDGAPIQWNTTISLRHVVSGKMLRTNPSGDRLVLGDADRGGVAGSFKLQPQYPLVGSVTEEIFFHLCWSSFFVSTMAENGADNMNAVHRFAEDSNDAQGDQVVLNALKSDYDVFGLRIVDEDTARDLSYTMSSLDVFRAAIESFDKLKTSVAEIPEAQRADHVTEARKTVDLDPAVRKASDLIRFVTDSEDNPDPFTREGIPIVRRQKMLVEQGVMEVMLHLIEVGAAN